MQEKREISSHEGGNERKDDRKDTQNEFVAVAAPRDLNGIQQ